MSGNEASRRRCAHQKLGKGYPVFSWYSIMAGMGIFPDARARCAHRRPKQAAFRIAEIDDLLERSAANYRGSPRRSSRKIPPRRNGESLQVYFW